MSTHLVWDWNGTLFHDIDAVIEATNASFADLRSRFTSRSWRNASPLSGHCSTYTSAWAGLVLK